jgi:hypothetical protein
MSSGEDQACSDALAAIRRWLELRLAKLEASSLALPGVQRADPELAADPNLQTALALTHIYEEALRISALQKTNTRQSRQTRAEGLEDTLRRLSPECDARSYSM